MLLQEIEMGREYCFVPAVGSEYAELAGKPVIVDYLDGSEIHVFTSFEIDGNDTVCFAVDAVELERV